SVGEFQELVALLDGRRVSDRIEFFVSTGRDVLNEVSARGWHDELSRSGIRVVTDTCTYITPILTPRPRAVMSNSAKSALYDTHRRRGVKSIVGCLVVLPSGRGSRSSASVLAEAIRNAAGPAGIVLGMIDPIIALGCHVAHELYRASTPVVVLEAAGYQECTGSAELLVEADEDHAVVRVIQ